MIKALLNISTSKEQKLLRSNQYGLIIEAILMGVGFILLVPILRTLFNQQLQPALNWLAVMFLTLTVYSLVRYANQLAGYRAAVALAKYLFSRIGDKIAQLPLGWFTASRIGQLTRLTSQGVIDVMGVPAHLLRPLTTALLTPITVIILMFFFDWRLALSALAATPLIFFCYRWAGNLAQSTEVKVDAAAADATGRIIEFCQNQSVLRSFSKNGASLHLLTNALSEQYSAGRQQMFTASKGVISFILSIQLAFTLILLFGTYLALGGKIDSVELIALLVLSVRYVEPLIGAVDLEGALRFSRNSLNRMETLLATKVLPEPLAPLTPKNNEIKFSNVSFCYDDTPTLQHIDFTIKEQSMTAIVGPSGSGKTTILRLLARFWDVDSGSVKIGGVDVREMSNKALMAQVSVVFQDPYLFEGSIIDNIRLANEQASEMEIQRAIKLARVDEIAIRLPNGLATQVGEAGAILSGGERQRVAIARAMLKDSPIVLLDEATSSLDVINEAAVQEALHALAKDKTLIVIAHQLSTVKNADQILFLEKGRIVEKGNHQQLLDVQGRYADFWHERNKNRGWRIERHTT